MFVSKKLLGKIPTITILNTAAPGDYSVNLIPGKYEFTIVGGGGCGIQGYAIRTAEYSGAAQGGVGGTLILVASVSDPITITAHVGLRAASSGSLAQFSNAGERYVAASGEGSYITDGTNNAFLCSGGTGASFYATTNRAGVGTPGVAGNTSTECNIPGMVLLRVATNSADAPIVGGTVLQELPNTYAPAIGDKLPGIVGHGGRGGTYRVKWTGGPGGITIKRLP